MTVHVPLDIEHHHVRRHARALVKVACFFAGVIVGVIASRVRG